MLTNKEITIKAKDIFEKSKLYKEKHLNCKYTIERLNVGLSNFLFKVKVNASNITTTSTDDELLYFLKIYGCHSMSDIINRPLEIFLIQYLYSVGKSVNILEYELSHRFETFCLDYRPLNDDEIFSLNSFSNNDDKVLDYFFKGLFNAIMEINLLNINILKVNSIDTVSHIIMKLYNLAYTKEKERKRNDFSQFFQDIIKLFDNKIENNLVLSHNDIHYGNIFINKEGNINDSYQLRLIDFEYCFYNYIGFDMANFLFETCFNLSHTEYPYYLLIKDMKSLFTDESYYNIFERFMTEYVKLTNSSIKYDKNYFFYLLALSSILWSLVAIISDESHNTDTEDQESLDKCSFNYRLYAKDRMMVFYYYLDYKS